MHGIGVPKPALYMAAALIAITFALAISARVFGFGAFAEPTAKPLITRSLTFTDADDGGIYVHDAETNTLATTLAPGTSGFVRGSLRALTRKRRLANIGADVPFELTRYEDGRLVLSDPLTKAIVSITSFGPTQVAAFDSLLTVGRMPGDAVPTAAAPAEAPPPGGSEWHGADSRQAAARGGSAAAGARPAGVHGDLAGHTGGALHAPVADHGDLHRQRAVGVEAAIQSRGERGRQLGLAGHHAKGAREEAVGIEHRGEAVAPLERHRERVVTGAMRDCGHVGAARAAPQVAAGR